MEQAGGSDNLSKSGIPLNGVNELAFDKYNDLWLIVSNFDLKQRGDKIVKFDGETFKIINPPDNFDKLNNTSVYGFYVDKNNVKWISTSENLIWYADTTWNFMDRYKTQIFFSCLSDIYCDEKFTWVCSTMGGLIRYNGTKFMVWNEDNSFLPNDITTVNKDFYGNLWIGTQNQGIILYNPEGIVYEEKK